MRNVFSKIIAVAIVLLACSVVFVLSSKKAAACGVTAGSPGYLIVPLNESDIRLSKVTVNVKSVVVSHQGSQVPVPLVTSQFTLSNPSKRQVNLNVGFPMTYNTMMFFETEDYAKDLTFTVDGTKITPMKKNADSDDEARIGSKYHYYYAWPVTFKPGEEKIITCTYFAEWAYDQLGGLFTFIAQPGSLWRGKIDRADFSFEMNEATTRQYNDDDYSSEIAPRGYTVKNNVIEWHFSNWLPTQDITISFEQVMTQEEFERALEVGD